MKIFTGLAIVMTIVLALAALATAAGTVTTSDYTVGPTTVPGVSTGLVLKKGKSVTVTATGVVCANYTSLCVNPGGNLSVDSTYTGNGGFELPGAPAYGLIGRVGSGPWMHVGSGPTTLSGKGELAFAVNDDAYGDNTGNFFVAVSYTASGVSETRTCWPGWGYGDTNHEHCGPPGLANRPPLPGQASQPTQGPSSEHGNPQDNEHGNLQENGNSKNK